MDVNWFITIVKLYLVGNDGREQGEKSRTLEVMGEDAYHSCFEGKKEETREPVRVHFAGGHGNSG